jgi:Skp family chaperone for outer membrane proteins
MSRSSFALGVAAAGLFAGGLAVGSSLLQPKPVDAGPKAEAKPLRAGFVCVSELMRDYTKWQERAKRMTDKRNGGSKQLAAMQGVIQAGVKQMEAATGEEKAKLSIDLIEARRKYEDAERTLKETIDKEAADHLKGLYADITTAVRAVADERGLDVMYSHPAHPARMFEQSKDNPQLAIDLVLRPPALQPMFLRDEVDLTAEVVKRLNAKADREE